MDYARGDATVCDPKHMEVCARTEAWVSDAF